MPKDANQETLEALRQQLNTETARIGWSELQRHFARGVLIKVTADLDLVDVAARIAADDRDNVAVWLAEGRVAQATTDDAIAWQAGEASFWAVVTAPWVVVQEIYQANA
jgi:hypothetical protein